MLIQHLAFSAIVAGTALSAAPQIVYDGVFDDTSWSSSIVTSTNNSFASYTAYQIGSGGNPHEYRYLTHHVQPDGTDAFNVIRIANTYLPFSLSAHTQIDSVSFSFDLTYFPNDLNTQNAMGYGLAVFQGTAVYGVNFDGTIGSLTSNWASYGRSGLTAADFCLITNSDNLNCGMNPDFSASNPNLTRVGYYIVNEVPIGYLYGDQRSGIDNFSVTFDTPTPEPASLWTSATVLILLGCLRARKRSARAASIRPARPPTNA